MVAIGGVSVEGDMAANAVVAADIAAEGTAATPTDVAAAASVVAAATPTDGRAVSSVVQTGSMAGGSPSTGGRPTGGVPSTATEAKGTSSITGHRASRSRGSSGVAQQVGPGLPEEEAGPTASTEGAGDEEAGVIAAALSTQSEDTA